jgi:hypothetical protein
MIEKVVATGDLAKHPPHALFRLVDDHPPITCPKNLAITALRPVNVTASARAV